MNGKNRKTTAGKITLVVLAVAAIAAVLAGVNGSDGTPSSQSSAAQSIVNATTPAVSPAIQSTIAGTGVPGDTVALTEFFGGRLKMTLHPTEWDVLPSDPTHPARRMVVRRSACFADNRTWCPGFAVVDTTVPSSKTSMPYPADGGCWNDSIHNGGLERYTAPQEVETTIIGGKSVGHMVLNRCNPSDPNSADAYEQMHMWQYGSFVFFDSDLDMVPPVEGLVPAFAFVR